ncbi:MAG TPA: EamA family transporter, partial [Azoarcus taiwanensis]|nr:EamA family transporter [Azoarcus taiwanensis]
LGILVLKERMAKLQAWAVGLAAGAIALQLLLLGQLPWIALLLALTFGTYGLLRKQVPLDGLSGLFVETLLLLPVGLLALAWLVGSGGSHFLDNAWQSSLLVASGVVTALPLMLFAGATRRLRLATVGFLMYINPTMQFLTALLIFGETLTGVQVASFGLIWIALALYSWSAWQQRNR